MISPEIVFSEIFTNQKLRNSCDGKDYSIWKCKILFIFANKGIDYVLRHPQPPGETPTDQWLTDDARAQNLIMETLDNIVLPYYKLNTAKSMMDHLESRFSFNPPSIQHRINVFRQYMNCRMDESSNISKHVLELQAVVYELEMAGVKVPDEMQAVVLMNSLPESWHDVVSWLNLQLKENELGFDNVSQRLRVAAEIIPRRGGNSPRNRGYCCLCRQSGHNMTNCPEDQDTKKNWNSDKNFLFMGETVNIFEHNYQRIKNCKKLNYTGTDFSLWKCMLSSVLDGSCLEYVIKEPKPPEPTDSTPEKDVISYNEWLANDFTCRHIILGAMEDNLFLAFQSQPTAKALMDKLNSWFDFPSLGRRMALFKQYVEWQMSENIGINDNLLSMKKMVGELKRAGIDVPDEIQAVVLIDSLPRSWEEAILRITMRIDKETGKGEKLLDVAISRVRETGQIRALNESMKSDNNYQGKSKKKDVYQGRY